MTLIRPALALKTLAVLVLATLASPALAQKAIVVVRHAEKALDQGNDPGLNKKGRARARALATQLAGLKIGAILTTDWRRTQLTAAPLASALGIEPQIVGIEGSVEEHAKTVAEAVRAQSAAAVLVVGHSNTVPVIISALGGPKVAAIADDGYDNLYLLWRHRDEVRFLHTRY